MKIVIDKQHIYTYIMAFIGLFMVALFIWLRFIRERLPRNIPFDLTLLSFFSLCFLCIIYFYNFYKICKNKNTNSFLFNLFIYYFSLLVKPLLIFDNYLKSFNIIHKGFNHIFILVATITKSYHLYTSENLMTKFIYIIINYIPNIILLTSLIFDILYLKKITFFYYVIPVTLLPIIQSYFLYSLTKIKQEYAQDLDNNFYVILDEEKNQNKDVMYFTLKSDIDGLISVKYFIEKQADNLVFDYKDLYEYDCIEKWSAREKYANTHNITLVPLQIMQPSVDYISVELAKSFNEIIPKIVYIQAFLEGYPLTKGYIKILLMQKIILFLFFCCWTYILILSIHTLNIVDLLDILQKLQDTENPFSFISVN